MTTQPEEQAVGSETVPEAQEPADAREAFEQLAEDWNEPEEAEEAVEAETGEESEDGLEIEAEDDDLPPIDAPVSWDAEAREKFAELPRDVQEYVAKRESERERFVQQKSQEATRAQREAAQQAMSQLARIEQGYAQQYQVLAQQFDVPEPDIALLATDPQTYALQAKRYQNAQAQRQEMQQAAEYYAQQAAAREEHIQQAEYAAQAQVITEQFPEYADPTTGPKLREELSGVARELGYPPELIAQARATDILAMRKAAEWKAKADRLDAMNRKTMEKVRAAKGLPKSVKPGVKMSGDQTRAARSKAAWERTKTASNPAERADAFAEYLQSTGQL